MVWKVRCDFCAGDGNDPRDSDVSCPSCDGKGFVIHLKITPSPRFLRVHKRVKAMIEMPGRIDYYEYLAFRYTDLPEMKAVGLNHLANTLAWPIIGYTKKSDLLSLIGFIEQRIKIE